MFTLGRKAPFGQLPAKIRVIACSLHLLLSQENGVSKTSIKILFVLIVGLAGLLLAGCPPRESIAKINQDPGRFAGKEISIAGQVTDSFGAAGNRSFPTRRRHRNHVGVQQEIRRPGQRSEGGGHRTHPAGVRIRRA